MQFHEVHVPALVDDGSEDGPLPDGALPVTVDLSDPGVCQSFLAVQNLQTGAHIAHIADFFRHVFGFFLGQCCFHTADGINDSLESFKADLNGVVHVNAEVLLHAFCQHFHAAQRGARPGTAQGVAHVDPVPAAAVPGISGQGNVEIPQNGNHGQGVGFAVDGAQNHGVGELVRLIFPVVLPYQHDVGDVLIGNNLWPGVLRRGGGRQRFFSGSQQRVQLFLG